MAALVYTLLVQLDLSGTTFGGAPTWTDVTRFVRLPDAISITNWRQDQQSTIAPSTMQLVLDNADLVGDATAPNAGRFTPGLATSPFYPRLLPGVRGRVRITIGGTTFVVYDGYALEWVASYDANGVFTSTAVSFTDILGWMGNLQPLRDLYVEEISVDNPIALYPLTEAQGATSAGNISTSKQAALEIVASKYGGGDYAFGSLAGPPGAGDATALQLNASLTALVADTPKGYYLTAAAPSAINVAQPWSAEVWVKPSLTNTANPGSVFALTNGIRYYGIGLIPDLTLSYCTAALVGYFSAGDNQSSIGGGGNITDGNWHHVVVTCDNTGIYRLYVDGALKTTWPDAVVGVTVNTLLLGRDPTAGSQYRGGVQYAAVYASTLSAARVLAHYQAGATAFAGETTSAHVARLLSYRTNLGSSLPASAGTIGVHSTNGISLQQALLDTGKAEGGIVYADGSGLITLVSRASLRNQSAVLTLDSEADCTVDYQSRIDLQQLVNDATISRPNGASQRVTDATSLAAFGVRAIADTYIVNSDADALNAAGWLVANQKTPVVRAPRITADLLTMTQAKAQATLAVTPLQRITVTNLPASAPTTDVAVQGRSISLSSDEFTVAFFTSQLPVRTLRADASPSAFTKLDNGLKIPW